VPDYVANLDSLSVAGVASSPSAVDSTDNKQAHTDFYNATISQRTPWSGLMEVSYVGNRTRDIPSSGNGGSEGFSTLNINMVPVGAMLQSKNGGKDPNNLPCVGSLCNGDQFRPYLGYSDLDVATNNGYSNYNALQVTWLRTKGKYDINMNYTYGKAMGIVGNGDQFHLDQNYGVLPENRTQIFNAAYHIDLPSPAKSKLGGEFVNGWQLSGITQLESGANLWGYSTNQNFNVNWGSAVLPGSISTLIPKGIGVTDDALLGTPDIRLTPLVTCDPRKGLGTHQFVNGNCFATPNVVGENGPIVMPPIYGPAFFNWDMGIFKNFRISESKSVEFRVNGYNFLNHPLWSFSSSGEANLTLDMDPTTYTAINPKGQPVNQLFGYATDRQGHRIIQFQFKFIF